MKPRFNFLGIPTIRLSREDATRMTILIMGLFLFSTILFGQSLILYIVALVLCSFFILQYPAVGLVSSLVLTMWFERHMTLQPLIAGGITYKVYPIDFFLLLTGIGVLIGLLQKKLHWQWKRLDTIIAIFGLLVTVAFARSFVTSGVSPEIAFSTFKNYILYAIIYVYASLLLTNRDEWQWCMKWFAIGGVGLFFFLVYGMLAGEGVWSEYTPLSTLGTRLIAGTHIFYMTLFSFWVLAMYIWESKQDRHTPPFILFLLAIIGVGLVVSLVRHLWIALLVLLGVWLIFFVKEERDRFLQIFVKGAVAFVCVGFIGVWLYGLVTGEPPRQLTRIAFVVAERVSVSNVINLTDSSFGWRVAAWQAGVDLWQADPIFGAGLGRPLVGLFDVTPFEIFVRDLHNNYLGILIQLGLVGIGLVVYWIYYVLKDSYTLWYYRDQLEIFEKRLLFTCLSWILLFVIVFSVSVYWDVNFFIIWWWFALAAFRWLQTKHLHV